MPRQFAGRHCTCAALDVVLHSSTSPGPLLDRRSSSARNIVAHVNNGERPDPSATLAQQR